jgi:hypothetical protein
MRCSRSQAASIGSHDKGLKMGQIFEAPKTCQAVGPSRFAAVADLARAARLG